MFTKQYYEMSRQCDFIRLSRQMEMAKAIEAKANERQLLVVYIVYMYMYMYIYEICLYIAFHKNARLLPYYAHFIYVRFSYS